MSPRVSVVPPELLSRTLYPKVSVAQYHQMIADGVLGDGDPVELVEGYLVAKMSHNNPHRTGVQWLAKRLLLAAPPGWVAISQLPIALTESEPEPDGCLARGDDRTYLTHPPTGRDLGLVVEVSDSSLQIDRVHMGRVYARESIPVYWVLNVADRQIEVYADPDPAAAPPAYRTRTDYRPGDTVPLVLDGQPAGSVAVNDLIP